MGPVRRLVDCHPLKVVPGTVKPQGRHRGASGLGWPPITFSVDDHHRLSALCSQVKADMSSAS